MTLRSNSNFKPQKRDVNCILMNGGVGDHVGGSLIAIDYLLKHYPWINLLVWVPDFLLDFARNVLPNAIIRDYSSMREKYNPDRWTVTTEWDGVISPMKMHVLDYAFLKLCDQPAPSDRNTLRVNLDPISIDRFALPKDYVCLATGFTAAVREFPVLTVNRLMDYLVEKGITPVFIGQSSTHMLDKKKAGVSGEVHVIQGKFQEEIHFEKGLSLIDQTSLLEAAKIMQGAKAMMGVDCGLLHVAACTDVPIVAGFTTVSPSIRTPMRHGKLGWKFYPVVPEESLECRFCQERTNFLYQHNYTKCIYNDLQCVSQMTAEKFITQIEKIL